MTITLPPELEALIQESVQSGLYNSPAEVVRESLRLLKERDDLRRQRHEELRREILLAKQAFDEGRYQTYETTEELAEEIIRRGMEKLNNQKQSG